MFRKIFFLILFLPQGYIFSQTNIFEDSTFTAGNVYYGDKNYTLYYAGNLPLILSAPHGGALSPNEIPDRSYGETSNDLRTKELTEYLRQAIITLTGKYPHVIINDLKRIKLDPNRDFTEGAQGNEYALHAWYEYQGFILSAEEIVNNDYGKGLYLDIHGHGHSILRIELGYLLTNAELNKSNTELNTDTYINKTSIKNLVSSNSHSLSFTDLLRGEYSFGSYLVNVGYPSVPSSSDPSPAESDSYFSGGYSTEMYGSVKGGTIDAIQMEHYRAGIRDSDTNVKAYAEKLAAVILDFMEYHYNFNLTDVETDDVPITSSFVLSQNYPNPFNPSTVINYQVPEGSFVTLKVFNLLGKETATLVNKYQDVGGYKVSLNAGGLKMPSGVYFYRLSAGNYIQTRKMILLK